MKKRQLLSVLTIISIMILASMNFVQAESQEVDWEYIISSEDIIVHITWPNSTPSITFVSPKGNTYNPFEGVTEEHDQIKNKSFFYIIEETQIGQWKVLLDKVDNESVEIGYMTYMENPSVENLTLGQIRGNYLPITFTTVHPDDLGYKYEISAAVDRLGGGILLIEGSATTNNEVRLNLDLNKLATYDQYMIYVHAYIQKDEIDYFDKVYSETFSWNNNSDNSYLEEIETYIYPEDNYFSFTWDYLDSGVDKLMVGVFVEDEEEPFTFVEYDITEEFGELSYPETTKNLTIKFSSAYKGVYNSTLVKEIDLTNIPIVLEDVDIISIPYITLNYSDLSNDKVEVVTNEGNTIIELTGTGSVDIALVEFDNIVRVIYKDEGINWMAQKEIFVDMIAPKLLMEQDYNKMVISDTTITLFGTVEDAFSIKVNGEVVEFNTEGLFEKKISLVEYETEVIVVVEDQAGNRTQYVAIIYSDQFEPTKKEDSDSTVGDESDDEGPNYKTRLDKIEKMNVLRHISESNYLLMIIMFVIALLIGLYALIVWRNEGKFGVIFEIFGAICFLVMTIYSITVIFISSRFIKSRDYIDLSLDDPEKALNLYNIIENYKHMMSIGLIGLGLFLLLVVIRILIKKLKQKTSQKDTTMKEEKKKPM